MYVCPANENTTNSKLLINTASLVSLPPLLSRSPQSSTSVFAGQSAAREPLSLLAVVASPWTGAPLGPNYGSLLTYFLQSPLFCLFVFFMEICIYSDFFFVLIFVWTVLFQVTMIERRSYAVDLLNPQSWSSSVDLRNSHSHTFYNLHVSEIWSL